MTTPTLEWTLNDAAGGYIGPTPKPKGTLALNYDSNGDAYYGAGTTAVAEAIYDCGASDAVQIDFTQRSGNTDQLDQSCTSESRSPSTLPSASWSPTSGAAVSLIYGTTGAGTWTHTLNTVNGVASIGLKLKTKVTRPPTQ